MTSCHNILSNIIKPWAVQAAGRQFVYFNYNPVGDNTKVYSAVANDWERTYTYDWLGRRLTYVEGELAESFTYDGGNLAAHSQSWTENGLPQTKTTTYHYNAHRLDSVSYDDALTTIYHYDQYGRVDSLYDESGVVCYQYGNMGEVTQEIRIYALPFLSSALALSTQFTYDSWGRIQEITYPDNEVVGYTYDLGGQLQSITNNSNYTYLDNVAYDRFGAKVSQEYGNGITTDYSYNNVTRRLSAISTTNNGTPMSQIQYAYDPVGNVTQVTSSCPWLNSQSFVETFTYDASDQLVSASETQAQSYQLTVTYGNWGKISGYSLAQTDLQHNTTQSETQAYTYPATNSIGNSQTLFAPEQRTITDANNNVSTETLTFGINGSLRKREVQGVVPHTEHYLFNSAANLKAYSNNLTDFAYYGYNASNTRAYKLGLSGSSQWVNGQQQSLHLGPQQAMFYPNAYVNFNQNGEYTKHYYNGSERIASRLGTVTLNNATTSNARLTTRSGQLEDRFRNDIRTLVYAGDIPMDMPPEPVSATLQTTGTSSDIFYYHTNHLGSTAYVTDQNRNVTQGFIYAPFGEITTEYNATFGNDIIPKYSFNAKELDEETGMYYYEARYYKPPVFTSRDPMFEKYFWMTPYAYCANNPVKYVDPSGRIIDGVTYNKKTKSFTYSEEAIARGTDKYIEARMATKSGRKSIMRMNRSRKSIYTLYVESRPFFREEKIDDEVIYMQIDGIFLPDKNNHNHKSIYISTNSFDKNNLNSDDLSDVLVFRNGEAFDNIKVSIENIIKPIDEQRFKKTKLYDFLYNNPERCQKQFIHGIGAHEERHLFQFESGMEQNEDDAERIELFERKQFIKHNVDCSPY